MSPDYASGEFGDLEGDERILAAASEVLREVRRAKSDAKTSMRTEVDRVQVTAASATVDAIRPALADLAAATRAATIDLDVGSFAVATQLATAERN